MTVAPSAQQVAAIEERGVVFLSAGAGTGKTTVLVERFVRSVVDDGVDVNSLLVITYTERAAGELRTRIRARLAELGHPELVQDLDGAWISTIHGFCSRVLRSYAVAAGLDPRFRVLDESQSKVLRAEAFSAALSAFCLEGESDRVALLATYGSQGLRSMLTAVHERLRSGGWPLELGAGDGAALDEALDQLREALTERHASEPLDAEAALAELIGSEPSVEQLLQLDTWLPTELLKSPTLEGPLADVQAAALESVARRDRLLLDQLLRAFDAAYTDAKRRESSLDFEDLQLLVRDLLVERVDIREELQWRFRSIMVDEFQDTNRLQCELVDLLATGELFFVGDEFQSIYRFRHADVDVFRERQSQSGGVLSLTENYRSRPEVLAVVNHVFRTEFGDRFEPLEPAGRFTGREFGPAVEVTVVDKLALRERGESWRLAEARALASRIDELVRLGACAPGEVAVLLAAGTGAEVFETALRERGLDTYRALGRGYYGQQQVVDILAYLRLVQNRYDDEALLTVLASPLVGVSNDALVLLRRAASRRPIFSALERALPPGLEPHDARMIAAFLQRYERLLTISESVSLEELVERVAIEHDYELAILARWDGRRRYANLRKLGRLARSYEDLRGGDIEGFIRFARELDEVGVRETEAVSEEEDADAVRLMTIHAAKGLEFKVVAVVDAGRAVTRVQRNEILCLPDGKFGFSVVDPVTGARRPAPGYEEIKSAEDRAADDEARRLYYVAMTRAIDRLLITGAVDPARRGRPTPIDWVLESIDAELASEGPRELLVDDTPVLLRIVRDEGQPRPPALAPGQVDEQLPLFPGPGQEGSTSAPPELPPLTDPPAPPRHVVRRLSYSALALYERCSLRFWAERFAGLRARERAGTLEGVEGLNPLELGDAVHVLIETAEPLEGVAGWLRDRYPHVVDENVARVRGLVEAWGTSPLAAELAHPATRYELPFTFVHDGVLLHGRFDAFCLREGHALLVDYKTNRLEGRDAGQIVDADYVHQLTVYALAAFRAGATSVEVAYVFLEQPDEPVVRAFAPEDLEALSGTLSEAISRINDGVFEPSPSEFGCPECPLHEVACDGLALLREDQQMEASALADPGPQHADPGPEQADAGAEA